MRSVLTDQTIRAMQPPPKGYRIEWDGNLKGFGCRISQAGTRAFVVLIESGRPHTIGRYPALSLAEARREARKLLAEKTLGRVKPTFVAFEDARDQYLAECERKNRASTVKSYRRHLTTHYPFGRQPITEITPRQVTQQLNRIEGHSEKHHAFVAGAVFFRWALRQGMVERSPMQVMAVPKSGAPRERVLSPDELIAVWNATGGPFAPFRAIVRLLILTGQRRGEIGALEWSWIKGDQIELPARIVKNKRTHRFPIGRLTVGVLESIPRLSDTYVFPAAREQVRGKPSTVFNGWGKATASLRAELGDGVAPFTLHDSRRTLSSFWAAPPLSVPQIVTEKYINHISGGVLSPVASVYNRHAYMDEMRAAVEKWERYLEELTA